MLDGLSNRKVSTWRYTSKGIVRLDTSRENPGLGAISMELVVELQRWDETAKEEVIERKQFCPQRPFNNVWRLFWLS